MNFVNINHTTSPVDDFFIHLFFNTMCDMYNKYMKVHNNHMLSKVWDEITYPFPNFNGFTVEVWEWVSNFILQFIMGVITCPYWDLS